MDVSNHKSDTHNWLNLRSRVAAELIGSLDWHIHFFVLNLQLFVGP